MKKQATKKPLHPKIYPKITKSTDFSASCKRWNVANNHALGSKYTSTNTTNKYCLLGDSFKSLYQIYSLNEALSSDSSPPLSPLNKAFLRIGYFPKESPSVSDPNASLTSFGSRPPVFQKRSSWKQWRMGLIKTGWNNDPLYLSGWWLSFNPSEKYAKVKMGENLPQSSGWK